MTITSIHHVIAIRDNVQFMYNGKERAGKVESINAERNTFTVAHGDGVYKQYAIANIHRMLVENAKESKIMVGGRNVLDS